MNTRSVNALAETTSSVPRWSPWARDAPMPERASLGQSIANSLREAIISGTISPGEQLKQDALSLDYKVSPAPVREALRQLESEGLVEHFPNRGVFVTDVPEEEALKLLFPIRLLVENYAMQHTAEQLKPELVAELEAQIEIMQHGADIHDVALINAADVRFHELAVEASGSRHSIQLWHSILPRIRLQFSRLTPRQVDLHHVAEEHEELLRALQLGNPDVLSAVLEEHISGISARLMARETPGK
jgi:DNA-binding GntR family transcriptional regulator